MGFVFSSDMIQYILSGIDIATGVLQLGIFTYLIGGGWITILRSISFFLDKLFISFISTFFEYFFKIINGTLIVPETVETVTKNVYFFIALILLFKLGMFILKYIMNPEMVNDENVGVHSLIKRVIIGMILILFMPTIFKVSRNLQSAILKDQVIEKVIMDESSLAKYNELSKKASMGRIIGFSVLQGFWSYDHAKFGSSLVKKQYDKALDKFDPTGININAGGLGYVDTYYYDYFPVLSTIALGYVLYIIIKLCLDVLIRSFKLAVLQIISPLTISDYMINNDKQGVFHNWLRTSIATYLMLFIRILSLWFVIWVTMLMQMTPSECVTNLTNNGVAADVATKSCGSSLLFLNESGQPDMLLRAMIIIALLAFVMDLPKLFSKIFNLDLEQESSVTGMISKIGGIGKMVGLGGLALGGGMLGGAIGSMKSGAQGLAKVKGTQMQNQARMDNLTAKQNKEMASLNPKDPNYAAKKSAMEARHTAERNKMAAENRKREATARAKARHATVASMRGMGTGALGQAFKNTAVGGAVMSGYAGAQSSGQNAAKEREQWDELTDYDKVYKDESKALAQQDLEDEKRAYRQHQMAMSTASYGQQVAANSKLDSLNDSNDEILQENRNINIKLGTNVNVDSVKTMSQAQSAMDKGFNPKDTISGKLDQEIQETRNINIKMGTNIAVDSEETMAQANAAFEKGFSYKDTVAGKLDEEIQETRNINIKMGTNIAVDGEETMAQANAAFDKGFSYNDTVAGKLDQEIEETRNLNYKRKTNKNFDDVSDTISGIEVSKPNRLTGDRTTKAGIILPNNIDVDNKE